MKCSLEDLLETLKPIAGMDYTKLVSEHLTKSDYLLSEIVVSCVIKYYAYEARVKKTRAVQLDNLLSAVGVRQFFATILDSKQEALTSLVISDSVSHEPAAPYTETDKPDIDNRIAAIKEIMSVLSNAAPEFQEKALLTLLGVL